MSFDDIFNSLSKLIKSEDSFQTNFQSDPLLLDDDSSINGDIAGATEPTGFCNLKLIPACTYDWFKIFILFRIWITNEKKEQKKEIIINFVKEL